MDGRNYSFLIKYDSYTLLPYAPSLKKKIKDRWRCRALKQLPNGFKCQSGRSMHMVTRSIIQQKHNLCLRVRAGPGQWPAICLHSSSSSFICTICIYPHLATTCASRQLSLVQPRWWAIDVQWATPSAPVYKVYQFDQDNINNTT
jgi:hypothetical protein